MWTSFWISCLCLFALLYVPSYLIFRSVNFTHIVAFAAAPILGVAWYAIIPVVYAFLGISCTTLSVVLPFVFISIICFVLSQFFGSKKYSLSFGEKRSISLGANHFSVDPLLLAAYIAMGLINCIFLFVGALDSPDAFYARWDNQVHLNMSRSFVESGIWSSLIHGSYLTQAENAIPITTPTSFYPSAWHDLVALTSTVTGTSIAASCNVVNVVLVSIVYPTMLFLLLKALFPKDNLYVAAGAFVFPLFEAMPWYFFRKGPLFPNMLALLIMIGSFGLLLLFLQNKNHAKKKASLLLSAIAAFIAMALSQPNALFAFFIFFVSYVMHVSGKAITESSSIPEHQKKQRKILTWIGIATCAILLWIIALHLPFLQGVIRSEAFETSLFTAILRVFALYFSPFAIVPALLVFVLAGIIFCLKNRKIWILFPALFFAFTYVIVRWGTYPALYQFFGGFWYSDFYRIGPFYSTALIPVAAIGLGRIIRFFQAKIKKEDSALSPMNRAVLLGSLATVLVIVCYLPGLSIYPYQTRQSDHLIRTYWQPVHEVFSEIYDADKQGIYTSKEKEFVNKCLEVTAGSLVLNQPNDGSAFSYGSNNLNTFFRHARSKENIYDNDGLTDEARIIKKDLYRYANDNSARAAVNSTGAQYLLQLDHNVPYKMGRWFIQYKDYHVAQWQGIDKVDDTTPGFEVVLAEDDMRLYRLTAVE